MEDLFNRNFSPVRLSSAGPFKVNGVPLRRVNQAYVIATSTKVDVSSVDVAKYADAYFKREVTKKKKGESEFFEAEKEVGVSICSFLRHDLY
jgi:large subunit ribosomal protein L6e